MERERAQESRADEVGWGLPSNTMRSSRGVEYNDEPRRTLLLSVVVRGVLLRNLMSGR